jgi:hypothetical protein
MIMQMIPAMSWVHRSRTTGRAGLGEMFDMVAPWVSSLRFLLRLHGRSDYARRALASSERNSLVGEFTLAEAVFCDGLSECGGEEPRGYDR